MSTFNGKIIEIPKISVDNFTGDNANSLIYFLSHCHTDHMKGLSEWSFHKSLVDRPDVYLYASPISVKILEYKYPQIMTKLKEISVNSPTLIKFPYSGASLTVTALPAGHCPGSVMFLFETEDKNILYTGDYRVSASDLQKYKAFYSLDKVKKIDKMYLDTTFFKSTYMKLPSRHESMNKICSVINEWVTQSSEHIIEITVSANYGSEFLFVEIAKMVSMPIHVNATTFNLYKCIPEMDKAVTLDEKKTQIHANCGNSFKKICKKDSEHIRTIVPSTLWWEGKNMEEDCMELTKDGRYRVCYSCHASFEEIQEFLLFLKPLEIEPCVVPDRENEKEEMLALIQNVISCYKIETELKCSEIKLFKTEFEARESTPEKYDDSLLGDILCSPERNFKRKRLWLKEDEDQCKVNNAED